MSWPSCRRSVVANAMAGSIPIDVALCSSAFEPLAELQQWPHQENDAATAIFIGRMRSQGSSAEELEAMQLEHYPGMTERQLQHLASDAASSHGVRAVLIRHRIGRVTPNQALVLVAVSADRRGPAQRCCQALLEAIKPDVLVKGGDYSVDQVVGHEFVQGYGGEVKVLDFIDDISTTKIVERIRDDK